MTTLRDELVALTSEQPAQPGDRLMSVTSRARRIRRTRGTIVAAAVLAVAAPVGIALSARGSDSPPAVVASPVTDWPDRSLAEDRAVAAGPLAQWTAAGGDATGLRWLYRGTIEDNGQPAVYVALWVADGKVVAASLPRADVDTNGVPREKGVRWSLAEADADSVPSVLSLMFFDVDRPVPSNTNLVLLLADPAARHLRWTTTPLPHAPTTGVVGSGRLTSTNGVFSARIGPLTGRLSATVEELDGASVPLTFPDGEPRLAVPPAPSTGGGSKVSEGADVRTADESGIELTDVVADRPHAIRIRCYGGGTLTVLVDDRSVGSATCDLSEQAVALPTAKGSHQVRLRGDHWQAVSWVVVQPAG